MALLLLMALNPLTQEYLRKLIDLEAGAAPEHGKPRAGLSLDFLRCRP